MSSQFVRILMSALLTTSVGFVGVLAHAMDGSSDATPQADNGAPYIVAMEANVPRGVYGPGHSIGLAARLSKPARGTFIAYLNTGVAVSLNCEQTLCKGEYWIADGHTADPLDVLFLSGSVADADGNVASMSALPEGASLPKHVTVRSGSGIHASAVVDRVPAPT